MIHRLHAYEKLFNIINEQRNENQNHKISPCGIVTPIKMTTVKK